MRCYRSCRAQAASAARVPPLSYIAAMRYSERDIRHTLFLRYDKSRSTFTTAVAAHFSRGPLRVARTRKRGPGIKPGARIGA
ncbi:hypothetical protein SPHINGO8AM_210089 [Sphingomonas sp. 8AM]|nr:hypothetical protein SPHINGO8AM_210089 [Sphingomonas sp. 8AM]